MNIFKKIQDRFEAINPNIRFVFWLLLFSVIYNYPSILVKRPQSVHHWRQADCASLALNYYQTGMHFFQPQTHNLTSDNNTSGYCTTSEIPVSYYVIACLYKIFGYHDFIFRFVNTLIFLTGLLYLFKACNLLFNNTFWSTLIVLFFFTSPVLVYYGNNFLTDSSALAFTFIAWYFFIKFYLNNHQKLFYISMLFFLLAGAYKISALLSLVAILIVFISESAGILRVKNKGKLFSKPIVCTVSFLLVFSIIGLWVYFAKSYNSLHGSGYFSTGIFPLWNLDKTKIQMVTKNIKELWLNQYYYVYSLYFFTAIFLFTIFYIKKGNRFLMTINILVLIGSSIYVVLWFWTLKDHDYYTINLYILLVFVFINFIWLIKAQFPKAYASKYLKILFIGFLLLNLNHARKQMKERYNSWWTEYPEYKDYHTITPYLRSIGIAPLDTVICLPDMSHFTLYLMNQRGWTECLGNNSDSTAIATSIKHGAKYLIVNGEDILTRNYLKSFLNNPAGQFHSIKIFKLSQTINR
ncbi:MAG: glycosyltransferase family 39 protein [Bacteroidota bacterium]|nr:glycosyltransferase family 39 protein [Bacteroidota bacterium]